MLTSARPGVSVTSCAAANRTTIWRPAWRVPSGFFLAVHLPRYCHSAAHATVRGSGRVGEPPPGRRSRKELAAAVITAIRVKNHTRYDEAIDERLQPRRRS